MLRTVLLNTVAGQPIGRVNSLLVRPLLSTVVGSRRSFAFCTRDDDDAIVGDFGTLVGASSSGASPSTEGNAAEYNGVRKQYRAKGVSTENRNQLISSVHNVLVNLGEDPTREGLQKTPARYADALTYLTSGYRMNLDDIVNNAIFEEDHQEIVLVKDINLYSLCEHHMLPFLGKVHIAYLPNRRVIGLSKLARIADFYARRLQVQERITKQIATTLMDVLQARGVGVIVEAAHLCMAMRGVEKTGASTVTSCMLGEFRENVATRNELIGLLGLSYIAAERSGPATGLGHQTFHAHQSDLYEAILEPGEGAGHSRGPRADLPYGARVYGAQTAAKVSHAGTTESMAREHRHRGCCGHDHAHDHHQHQEESLHECVHESHPQNGETSKK